MVKFEFILTTLKTIVRTKTVEDATSNPMNRKSKEEAHNLYHGSFYEIVVGFYLP